MTEEVVSVEPYRKKDHACTRCGCQQCGGLKERYGPERENIGAHRKNTGAQRENTCAQRENTCAHRVNTCAQKENTCAEKGNTCAQKENTCAQKENTCARDQQAIRPPSQPTLIGLIWRNRCQELTPQHIVLIMIVVVPLLSCLCALTVWYFGALPMQKIGQNPPV
ncbi:hypothetical protein BsWGS_15859 [Bradybaena similaris]